VKTNASLFLILAIFFWLSAGLYLVWSLLDPVETTHPIEWVGVLGIALSGILSALISVFLRLSHRGQGGELPEDLEDALVDDGEAEQGFFSPWSWWPIMIAFAAGLMVTGLAIGVWIAFIGAAILIVSVIGWQYEYYRGHFAH
jgi:hypothetical protein